MSSEDYVSVYKVENSASVPLEEPLFRYRKANMKLRVDQHSRREVNFKANETISRNYLTLRMEEEGQEGLTQL